MTYSLKIERSSRDPTYVNGLTQWVQVTSYLRKKLDQWATRVHIYKYSSDDRLLGEKCVTMSNICDVAFTLRDKQVL
jgi:hypothetical protein